MPRTLIITGPTATGKTGLAVALARRFHGEIISADCRQVYAGLDLGTGKDLEEYGTPPDVIPYHLIDVVQPNEEFHLLKFLQLAQAAIDDITSRGRLPIIAGGTTLYINALLKGYELPGGKPDVALREQLASLSDDQLRDKLRAIASPELLARTDLNHRQRLIRAIEIASHPATSSIRLQALDNTLILAPFYDRQTVRKRIEIRLDQRLANGMIDEVRRLHDNGVSYERLEWYGLEYRFIGRYLQGLLSFDDMRTELLNHIRSFAKSQDIWFRKLERENHPIHWLPEGNFEKACSLTALWLDGQPVPPPDFRMADILYGKKTS